MKKNYFLNLLAVMMATVLSVGMTSCKEEDDDSVNVIQNSVSFDANGEIAPGTYGGNKITVNSSTAWTAVSSETWCKVSPTSGNNGDQLTIEADPNGKDEERNCIITLTAGSTQTKINVSQEKGSLSVTPSDINLLKNAYSSASFTISTSGLWTAECPASWVNLSSKSGDGRTTVTVTALSDNDTAEKREAIITVKSGEIVQQIAVSQEPKFVPVYANVNIDDAVILASSYAIPITYEGDVSYYYGGVLSKSASAGWTDDKVISELTGKFSANKPGEDGQDLIYNTGFSANTTYIFFTVAFTAKGEQGPVQRVEFTTPRKISNRPKVTYTSITAWKDQWEWSTVKNAFAKRYYMIVADDAYALVYSILPDAATAYNIREGVKSGYLSPIVDSGTWYTDRTPDTEFFFSASWAQGDDGAFASEIDKLYVDPSMFSRKPLLLQDSISEPKGGKISQKELREALAHTKVFMK